MITLSSEDPPIVVNPPMSTLTKNPVMFLAFGFGSGLAKYFPGTFGTLASVPLYFLLAQLNLVTYALVVCAAFIAGVFICKYAARVMMVHDHRGIVWDEFVGFWITMLGAPVHWLWVVLGFIFFRIFDMAKPWPISWVDKRVHGGFGIMLDDVLAGIFAWGALQLTIFLTASHLSEWLS